MKTEAEAGVLRPQAQGHGGRLAAPEAVGAGRVTLLL